MTAVLTPAEWVARLLTSTDAWLRRLLLREAHTSCRAQLAYLDRRRLLAEEQGWVEHWHLRHAHLTETLAELQRALATR